MLDRINLYCLEQTNADVPESSEWLTPNEKARLASMRFPRRRADWRLGRWTAKQALTVCMNLSADPASLACIEIRSAPSGAPRAFVDGEPSALTVSLSHRSGVALCAVAPSDVRVGCDLEVIEPRSEAFIADYFTDEEQRLVRRTRELDRPQLLALLWSAKESALKALQTGLRLDTRSIDVKLEAVFTSNHWHPLLGHYSGEQIFNGWWRSDAAIVRTVVADALSAPPVPLVPAHCAGRS